MYDAVVYRSAVRAIAALALVCACSSDLPAQFRSAPHWRSDNTYHDSFYYGRSYGGAPIRSYFGFGANNYYYSNPNWNRGYGPAYGGNRGYRYGGNFGRQQNNFYFNGQGNQYNMRFGR